MENVVQIFCLSIVCVLAYFFYKRLTKNLEFFAKRNVAHEKPIFLVGNNLSVLEGKETSPELLIRLHKQFKDEKIYGYHDFGTPKFFIRDPQLIKKIAGRYSFLNPADSNAYSELKNKDLNKEPKELENLFSEDKVSQVFNIVNDCNKTAIKYLQKSIKPEGNEIDLEDYFHRYVNDVIATAIFGKEINSSKDKDNEFLNMSSSLLRSRSLCAAIKSFYLTISPQVYKVYRLNRINIKIIKFVRNIFGRVFGSRKKDQIIPEDQTVDKNFLEILTAVLKKCNISIKSVIMTIFPQIAIVIQMCFFVPKVRKFLKTLLGRKSVQPDDAKTLLDDPTEMDPDDKKVSRKGTKNKVSKKISDSVKSFIFETFPQMIVISRLYVISKAIINYMRGKTVPQEVHHKKKLSKKDAALLKLEKLTVVIKILLLKFIPSVSKIVKINVFNKKALNYVKDTVNESIRQRQNDTIVRTDMIHLMLEVSKREDTTSNENDTSNKNPTNCTENEIVSQCINFLLIGQGPITKILSATVYELMKNPEVQENLYKEIFRTNEELNGADITYELLTSMKYLDMVVSESLRKWPSVPVINRYCSKSYNLSDVDASIMQKLETEDKICFSVYGSHFDEEYFKNPYTFDPERFNEENKPNIKPFTYFPFGVGDRNCKVKYFGLMVTKIMLYYLILEFKIDTGTKTTLDLFRATRRIQLKQSEFFWMKLLPRNVETEVMAEA